MRTSTLASWIDSAAVASMAEELCPRDEGMHGAVGAAVESGVWVGGRGLRHEKVAVASYPSEEEVSRARLRLEAIRAQARHSGLIDHTLEAVKAEVPGRITPVVDEVDGKTDAAEAGAGEAGAEGDPVGVPAAAGEGPFQEMRREAAPATEVAPGGDAGGAEEAADYVIPQGTLGVRMGSFAVWVAEVTGGADVFVIDGQGYPLVERGGDADLFAARACEICQLDITHCGGFTEARRIAALAEAYRIALAPHNPQGPVSTAASLEFGFSQPSYIICESVHNDVPWRSEVVEEGFVIDEKTRTVSPNTQPGLGVTINEEAVKRHPFEQEIPQRVFHNDGSVGDW